MIHRASEATGDGRAPWGRLLVLCGVLALHNAMRIGPVTFIEELRGRYGVDYAGRHWARRLLRFYIKGNPHVSKR